MGREMTELPTADEYRYYNSLHPGANRRLTYFSSREARQYLEESEVLEVSASFEALLCDGDNPLIPDDICFQTRLRDELRPFIPPEHVHDRTAGTVGGTEGGIAYKYITLSFIQELQKWVQQFPLWRVRVFVPNPDPFNKLRPGRKPRSLDIVIYPQGVRYADLPFDEDNEGAFRRWQEYYLESTDHYQVRYETEFKQVELAVPAHASSLEDAIPVKVYEFTLFEHTFHRLWLLVKNTPHQSRILKGIHTRTNSVVRPDLRKLANYGVTSEGIVGFRKDVESASPTGDYTDLQCWRYPALAPCRLSIDVNDRDSEGNYTISRRPLEFPINPSDVIKHE